MTAAELQLVPSAAPAPRAAAIPYAKRLFITFGIAYLGLYNLPFAFETIPFTGWAGNALQELWNLIVPPVARAVFHVTADVQPNGSGDTTWNYVQLFCLAMISQAVALVWSLDRSEARLARAREIFRIFIRFSAASALISYGAVKVIQSQFPAPTLDRLVQPFGDASPMGLLWTFMGFSAGYNVFCGAGEMLGGLLLTVRRTALLGALVSMAVVANIVTLNFFYDVPVKLYSSHLLLMAVVIAAPDLRRLADFFVFNRPVEAAPLRPLFRNLSMEQLSLVMRTLAVAAFVFVSLQQAWEIRASKKSPLLGVWLVDEISIDGRVQPPDLRDQERWKRMIFEYPQMLSVQLMSDTRQRYSLKLDEDNHLMTLKKRAEPKWQTTLTYSRPAADRLIVDGPMDGHAVHAVARRVPMSFPLMTRGFHWINETPFNR